MSYIEFKKYFPAFSFLEPLFENDKIPYQTWKKGEFICHCNSDLNDLVFFTSGRGRAYRLLSNGKEVLYGTYGRGQIAGDVEYILESQSTTCSLESSDNLSGFRLPTSEITSDIYEKIYPLVAKEVAKKLIGNSIQQTVKLGYTLEERLAYHLIYEYSGGFSSMEELAGILGTTYRHLSRIFKKFSVKGLLILENKSVTILEKAKLKELCNLISHDFNLSKTDNII